MKIGCGGALNDEFRLTFILRGLRSCVSFAVGVLNPDTLTLMKPIQSFLTLALTVSCAVSAHAGGFEASFQGYGLPLLRQSPALAEIITSTFSVEDAGRMGPSDAPFDRGRQYTYMEFRATASAGLEQRYILRLHFKSLGEMTLQRIELELVPVKDKLKDE